MATLTTTALTFHRSTDGAYRVETQGASEFSATVRREGSVWRADVLTFGQILTSKTHRTLADARADVQRAWSVVEPACMG